MKVLVLLLLSLQGYADGQDKRFRIRINGKAYQLQLCNCTDNCTTSLNLTSLTETRLCYCKEITGRLDCNMTNVCVNHINTFINNNCETTDQCVTCLPLTPTPITSTPITSTICTNGALSTVTTKVVTIDTHGKEQRTVAALAALTGLLSVTLVLVVTGWVWTYWTMKKKNQEIQLCKSSQEQKSEEQFCLNPTHKMPTTQPVVGTAIEQLLHSLEESGKSNNGLSRKDNKGHCDVKRVENFYTSSEGSSNSSLQQQQAVNRVEEGESGEKHVYHVLEKPGGDDYEDLDKDLEENSAMEYETPLPLKELRLKHASIHTN